MPRLAVLGYHKIGPSPRGGWETWFYVPEWTFVRQLEALRAAGWEPVSAEELRPGLSRPDALPERVALVTFDDGYSSLLAYALPALERLGIPAVCFVPSDFVGGRNSFDRDVEPEERICGWEELRELERRGVSVQSHGASHRSFSELSRLEREHELRRSKATLEDGLGTAADLLAYPFGDAGPEPLAVARAGYLAAFLYSGGPNRLPPPDPFRLERVAMGPDTDLRAELGEPAGV